MRGRLWGLVSGAVLTVVISMFLVGGGASVVFLVPLLALVLLPIRRLAGNLSLPPHIDARRLHA